jgi:hypothetical protein
MPSVISTINVLADHAARGMLYGSALIQTVADVGPFAGGLRGVDGIVQVVRTAPRAAIDTLACPLARLRVVRKRHNPHNSVPVLRESDDKSWPTTSETFHAGRGLDAHAARFVQDEHHSHGGIGQHEMRRIHDRPAGIRDRARRSASGSWIGPTT